MKFVRPAFRTLTLASICLGALALAACSNATGGALRRDTNGNLVPTLEERDPAGTLYANTLAKADGGDCSSETLNTLTCFAYRGHGYEGAQTSLGQCLLREKKDEVGLLWLKRAADAGWPDAQKALAHIYLEGKIAKQDNVEAAAWNTLYVRNPSLLSLGVRPEGNITEELRALLTADERSAADRRVSAWAPSYWQPSDKLSAETAATCRVRMKSKGPDMDAVNSLLKSNNAGDGY
ncbi:hypothetical protein F2P47_15800 [Parvibaculum sedimenti]|uniref:Sel1 repeat family protein n=1 Tax=Parvibaculum sedimenti TaxID=2608632 RepID=A0A6N6VFR4_9HYPH|nr:sel1 repeat family protein [Parvibaculum sedimenti]KAB7738724.1 hypothetical protein F2P47_15800 [Parvibaculum sedimenti]